MLNKAVRGIYSHLMYVLPGYMQHLFNRSWMIRYTKNMRIRKLNSYDTNIPIIYVLLFKIHILSIVNVINVYIGLIIRDINI